MADLPLADTPGADTRLADPWREAEMRETEMLEFPRLFRDIKIQESRAQEPAGGESRGPQAGGARSSLVNVGLGFTIDPDTFLMFGELDVPVGEHGYWGPLVQMGVDDDRFLLAPAAHYRHEFPLPETDRVTPWVQGGAGLIYGHRDSPGNDDDDVGLLLLMGGGVEVKLTDRVSARFGLLVNVLPVEVLGDHVFVSIELLSITFRI